MNSSSVVARVWRCVSRSSRRKAERARTASCCSQSGLRRRVCAAIHRADEEAGLVPGTKAMEDRDRDLLARMVLAQMLLDAEEQGDTAATLTALADLSLKKGPDAVEAWLMTCTKARKAWFGPGAWQPPLRRRVSRLLGMAADASEADVVALCADDRFDTISLRLCMAAQAAWGAKTGRDTAAAIGEWLSDDRAARAAESRELLRALFTQAGDPPAIAGRVRWGRLWRELVGCGASRVAPS